MRLILIALAGMLAFGPALAQQSTAPELAPAAREALRGEIRAYLLEHPEVIYEAIQVLEKRRSEAAALSDIEKIKANADQLLNDGHSFVEGNPNGDVTVIEFSDYRCGYCRKAHPEIKALLAHDPNVRVIVKDFPILGPESVSIARMALAAQSIDLARFAGLRDKLMSHPSTMTETTAYRLAGEAGFDIAALKTAAAAPAVDAKLAANYKLADALGLQGTPNFIIGTEIVRGYLPAAELAAAVAQTRSKLN